MTKLIVEFIPSKITNQYLIVNIEIVSRDMIEDANKYKTQPTFLNSLFWNVIKEQIPLARPMRNIIIVIPAVDFINEDCLLNEIFHFI